MAGRSFRAARTPRQPFGEAAAWGAAAAGLSVATGVLVGEAPLIAFGVLAAVFAAYAFAIWPLTLLFGVVLVRASLDTSGEFFSVGGTNLAGFVNAAVVLGGGLAIAFTWRDLPVRYVTIPLLGLLALASVSLAYTRAVDSGFETVVALGAVFVVFVLAAGTIRREVDFGRLVNVVLLASVVPIVVALVELAGGGNTETKDGLATVSGTFGHPNGLSFFLLVSMSVALVALIEAKSPPRRLLLGVLLAAGAVSLVFTFGRSAWIGTVVVLILLAATRYRALFLAVPVIAVMTLLVLPSAGGLVEGRFQDLSPNSTAYSENSWAWRQKLWGDMLPLADDRPLLGYGIGSFAPLTVEQIGVSPRFGILHREDGNPAHNDYLGILVELGVPGLLLWLAVLVGLAIAALRARRVPALRSYAVAMLGVMITFVVISGADNLMLYTAVLYYVAALTGGLAGVTAARGAAQGRV